MDLLIPVNGTDETRAFIAQFPHLFLERWRESIFERKGCQFADVRHVLRRMHAHQDKQAELRLAAPTWDQLDPLNPLLSLLFGLYPDPTEDVPDYRGGIRRDLEMPDLPLDTDRELPPDILERLSPLALTAYDLSWKRSARGWLGPALVLGSSTQFDDLVLFWNLRAAGAPACFYDQAQGARLKSLANRFLTYFRGASLDGRPAVNVWINAER